MPKFKVNVSRTAYSNLDITVEADTVEEAELKAVDTAGNYSFPNEHTSDYNAQGSTQLN